MALEWLRRVFIPQTRSGPRLLIMDGHGSHTTDDFMFLCFQHQIYLLFLPPHTSHVLQPLDLSVFSPLKPAYRKWASQLFHQSSTAPFGKLGFLICLQKACIESFTAHNIKSGWRVTGLWPVNVRKPLSSSRVLAIKTNPSNPSPKPSSNPPTSPHTTTRRLEPQIYVPRNGSEVQSILRAKQGRFTPSTRLTARKIGKGMDTLVFNLVNQEEKCKALEDQLQKLEPKRRRAVRAHPNEKFVQIEQIIRVKEQAAKNAEKKKKKKKEKNYISKQPTEQEMEHETNLYVFEEMCLEWQL